MNLFLTYFAVNEKAILCNHINVKLFIAIIAVFRMNIQHRVNQTRKQKYQMLIYEGHLLQFLFQVEIFHLKSFTTKIVPKCVTNKKKKKNRGFPGVKSRTANTQKLVDP